MSYTVDLIQRHKTPRVFVFLPIAFGLIMSMWVPSLARSPIEYGSVAEEKEIGNGILPYLDARPSDA
jgi:hypothetical protein